MFFFSRISNPCEILRRNFTFLSVKLLFIFTAKLLKKFFYFIDYQPHYSKKKILAMISSARPFPGQSGLKNSRPTRQLVIKIGYFD